MRRVLKVLFASILCINLFATQIYAADKKGTEYSVNSSIIEGPSVTFVLNEQNNYTDSILLKGSSGITTVTCKLSGGVAGVHRLYKVLIYWNGTNQVQSLRANELYICSSNILKPHTYYSKPFSISGLSACSGCREVGTVYLKDDVHQVIIGSRGLQAYFYNRDFWISTGDFRGPVNL